MNLKPTSNDGFFAQPQIWIFSINEQRALSPVAFRGEIRRWIHTWTNLHKEFCFFPSSLSTLDCSWFESKQDEAWITAENERIWMKTPPFLSLELARLYWRVGRAWRKNANSGAFPSEKSSGISKSLPFVTDPSCSASNQPQRIATETAESPSSIHLGRYLIYLSKGRHFHNNTKPQQQHYYPPFKQYAPLRSAVQMGKARENTRQYSKWYIAS